MLIGILSDIHANQYALMPVLENARQKGVSRLFILGDMIGYYFGAKKVMSLLSEWNTVMIRGNHEDLFESFLLNDETYRHNLRERLGSGFDRCANDLDSETQKKLISLPVQMEIEVDGTRFLLCHGSPNSTTEYVYPDAPTEQLDTFCKIDIDIILMGHTHHPMIRSGNSSVLINPGSVGQSRVTGGLAQWGVFNTKNKVYSPVNTLYDTRLLKEEILANGVAESHFIFQVLNRNR